MPRTTTCSLASLDLAFSSRVAVVYVGTGAVASGVAQELIGRTGHDLATLARAAGFEGRRGQVIDLVAPSGLDLNRLLVLGQGSDEAGAVQRTVWAHRGGSLAAKLSGLGIKAADIFIDEAGASPEMLSELVAGAALRHYAFTAYRSAPGDAAAPLALTLHTAAGPDLGPALADRLAVADGTILARDLVNEPPNVLGPAEFTRRAEDLAALGVTVEVLDEEAMAALGMGALLAVGQGSERKPRLVVMRWNGGGDAAPLAFVGKGVVFDTGGISIKPAASMEDMKGDMGGAAAVVGLFAALATRKAHVNAVGVIGIVENMPDGRAYRPGDILKAMSGKTIEIVNTDAEGRLVLADALWYTQDRLKPQVIVDLATLTGAIVTALGHSLGGIYSNTDALVASLFAAGRDSGEPLWHMPLGPAYEKLIESRFADIKNSGGRKGGSSAAAHFLQHFVNGVPWAHLDIAGVAFGAPNTETNTSWATGYGVALLDRWIRDNHEAGAGGQ